MKKQKTFKTCVIYLRVSEDRDDQQSIDNQKREALAYAAEKGWLVVDVIIDLGKSGYKKNVKRPGFDKAMMLVQTKQAEVFLVFKISRFIRRIREFHKFLDELIHAGGGFDSVRDEVDYMSASGELILALMAGLAQLESANKADFAESWNEGRTAKGAVPQGPRPFGYDRLERDEAERNQHGHAITLVPNPAESEALRFAAEWLMTGKTLRWCLKELNGMQGAKGTPLTARGLRSALISPTTAGLRVVKDEDGEFSHFVQGCWKPILPREDWDKVVSILTDPERKTYEGDPTHVRHLLSGIMECGLCGGKFGVRKWKQNPGTNKNGTPRKEYEGYRYTCFDCNKNSGKQDTIDEAVKARVLQVMDQPTWKSLKEQGRGYDPEVMKQLEAEQLQLAKMYPKQISLAQFTVMNDELNTRIAQATGAEPLDLPDVENLADSWDSMSVVDKRRVLVVGFELIKLDPANGTRDTLSRLFLRRAV